MASVVKMWNPPTTLQEDPIHNIIRRMNILHPRTQEVLPRWHLSIVLKRLMKPPFAINSSDKNLSLELLSYKTAFIVTLATRARGSELIALLTTWTSRLWISEPDKSPLEWCQNSFIRTNVLNTYSETAGIPENNSFISKGSWKTHVSREDAMRLPV